MKLHLPLFLRYVLLLSVVCVPRGVAAVGSTWDPAWGAAGLADAPNAAAPQYQADITTDGVTALVAPPNETSPYDFGTYTAITLTGTGNANAQIFGGASATQSTETGTVTRSSWIAAEQGSYNMLVGGSFADNWQSGATFSFIGDSHIMVDGATVAHVLGANYKDAHEAGFTGNTYLTIASGNVTGSIVGGTVVTHNKDTTLTGDTNVFVYIPLTDNSGPQLNALPVNMIMGGNAWGTNTWKTQTLTGSAHVTVDLSRYTGEPVAFAKHIVGAGYNGASGNTQNIGGDTVVTVNLAQCSTAENVKVIGGAWVNAGNSAISGTSRLSITGGTFNSLIIGGSFSESSGTTLRHGDIALTLNGGTFQGSVWGASYFTGGSLTGETGAVTISLGPSAQLNNSLYGGYGIYGDGNLGVNASLGDVSITLAGATVTDLYGGSYTTRNAQDSLISQGDIRLSLQSGTVQGNIFAAGQQDGSTAMQTNSTTIELSANVQLSPGTTVSGAYAGNAVSSVVTGTRLLSLTSGSSYNHLQGVSFRDFDEVAVATEGSATLSQLLSDSGSLVKSGGGSLALASHSDWSGLTLSGGQLALQAGADAALLQSLTMAEGTSLSGITGTLSAGSDGQTVLNLVLGTANIGANAAATPMIYGLDGAGATLELTGGDNVTLDISADGVVDLLLAHRDATPAISSYLTLTDGELLCEAPGSLALSALLNTYGLRIAGVADGSLIVNGSTAGIYYVTADAATTDPHLITSYTVPALYNGVVIEGDQQLTLSLPGDETAAMVASINNLMGATGSRLVVENSTGTGIATVALNNYAISSTGDANYPDIPARTTMQGSISAGKSTVLLKRGGGELVVNSTFSAEQLRMEEGSLSLNGGDNRIGILAATGGTLQLGGALHIEQSISGNGSLVVAPGATLYWDGADSTDSAWLLTNNGHATATRPLTLGALTLGSGSVSTLHLQTDTNFADSIRTGALTVQENATVHLLATGTRLLNSGDYTIGRVTAPANIGIEQAVALQLGGFSFARIDPGTSYLYTTPAGDIVLHAERYTQNQLLPYANNHNAATGARLLWDSEPPAGGDLAQAYRSITELIAAGKSGAAGHAMAAVAGASLSALGSALHSDVERQLRTMRNRTATMGADPCIVNENMPYYHFWAMAEGNHRHLNGSSSQPGYDFDRWGATMGMQAELNPRFTLGMALSTLWGKLKTDTPDRLDSDVSTTYLSLFARYRNCSWWHTLIGAVGWAEFDNDRSVHIGPTRYRTHSSPDGHAFGLMYELAYDRLPHAEKPLHLQPLLQIAYRHSSVGSFTETGSDAALRAHPDSMDTLTLAAGARLQAVIGENWYNRSSLFECRALLSFDLGDHRSDAKVALVRGSASGSVRGEEPGAFGAELGAGLYIPLGAESGTLFFDASVLLRSHLSEINGVVGYQFPF